MIIAYGIFLIVAICIIFSLGREWEKVAQEEQKSKPVINRITLRRRTGNKW